MHRYVSSLIGWLMNIFNPPPLETMSRRQKINRSFLISLALFVNCILLAMLLALGIYLYEKSERILKGTPEMMDAVAILSVSIGVNIMCVFILFQVKKADQKLMAKISEESKEV